MAALEVEARQEAAAERKKKKQLVYQKKEKLGISQQFVFFIPLEFEKKEA